VGRSSNRIGNPADLELIFLDSNGQLKSNIGALGSVTAQVGLGDSRIAGLDFQVIGSTLYIVTAGYTEVSGNDLQFRIDNSNPNSSNAVTSASRPFSVEDIGATLTIVSDGNVNSPWLVNDYTIVDVDATTGTAFLDFAPAELGVLNLATNGWWTLNGSTDMLISRFAYDATADQVALDTTFGRNGHVILPVASGVNNFDYAYAVDVDSLNRIVVAGYSQNLLGEYDMSVARLQPNGGLDTTLFWGNQPDGPFANRGRVMINVRSDDYANAVSVTPSGQIFIAGSSNGRSSPAPTFIKLDTFGVPITSFGSNGDGIVAFSSAQSGRGFVNSTAIYPADAGAVAGFLIATGTSTGSNRNTFVARLNSTTGALDTSFGSGGVISQDLAGNGNDWGNSVALQPAGGGLYGVVIAGSVETSGEGYNMYVARYLSNGSPDNTFFGNTNLHVLSELQNDGTSENPDYGATVNLDASNRIVVTGSSFSGDNPDFDMAAARLVGTPLVASARLNAVSRSITENDAGTANIAIDLLLTAKPSAPVTVKYTTENGTGIAGVDYLAKSGSVTFGTDTTRKTVTVQMMGNTDYQPNRTFNLKVLSVTGAQLGTAVATITIRENDGTWQNVAVPEDVDADNDIEPQDVLRLADDYRANGPRQLTQALATPTLWSDVNGDTIVSPADILAVLDTVNRKSFIGGHLLATIETSTATSMDSQSIIRSMDAEIATGLAAPVSTSGTATAKLALEPPVTIPTRSLLPTLPVLRAAAVDSAMTTDLADESEVPENDSDSNLYELISDVG
jgi:uncharacterized delta-60 repeat protein